MLVTLRAEDAAVRADKCGEQHHVPDGQPPQPTDLSAGRRRNWNAHDLADVGDGSFRSRQASRPCTFPSALLSGVGLHTVFLCCYSYVPQSQPLRSNWYAHMDGVVCLQMLCLRHLSSSLALPVSIHNLLGSPSRGAVLPGCLRLFCGIDTFEFALQACCRCWQSRCCCGWPSRPA